MMDGKLFSHDERNILERNCLEQLLSYDVMTSDRLYFCDKTLFTGSYLDVPFKLSFHFLGISMCIIHAQFMSGASFVAIAV
jgi:hypothetical protein